VCLLQALGAESFGPRPLSNWCTPGSRACTCACGRCWGRNTSWGTGCLCRLSLLDGLAGCIPPVGCWKSVCFMGSVRVGVDSLDTTGDGFLVVIVVSFRPLGSVRVVTVALGSLLASFFIAALWVAMAVCFFVVKPAVVSPGVATPVSMLLRAALVRVEAEGQRQQ